MRRFFDRSQSSEPIGDPLERTLVIVKGDAIARGIVGQIITQIEKLDLKLIACKTLSFDDVLIEGLYGEHKIEPFFEKLQTYLRHGYHMAMIVQGRDAVSKLIQLKGRRVGHDKMKTLRKQFAMDSTISTVHCSDSQENALKEMNLLFKPGEIPETVLEVDFYHTLKNDMIVPDVEKRGTNCQ